MFCDSSVLNTCLNPNQNCMKDIYLYYRKDENSDYKFQIFDFDLMGNI